MMITGHREEKLSNYDKNWIATSLFDVISNLKKDGVTLAYSGMASGVDLWFCEACIVSDIPFIACVPFETQGECMSEESRKLRSQFMTYAKEIKEVKNSWMVEHCDVGIVIWDANKGGTHNVLQQLVEKSKPFYWINPVSQKVWKCF